MRFPLIAVLVCALMLPVKAITITQDGQPAATIVIAEKAFQAKRYTRTIWAIGKPDEKVRSAAEDLQYYIEKISGARLPIVADTGEVKGAVILVGQSSRTKGLPLQLLSGVTKDFKEEGYSIYARGDTLALAGNDAGPYHGSEYAVFELLQRLGARWYMPTEYGEYLPARKTITVHDITFRDKPAFVQRMWWQNGTPENQASDAEFKIRNKMDMGQVLPGAGDGTLRQWLPDEKYQKTNPEYFGKNPDGTMNPTMVNLTNPDVPALVAEKMKIDIKKQIEQGIEIPSVAIAPDDGMPIDFTPETMKGNLGFTDLAGRQGVPAEVSVTEEWFNFVNKVTELVVKDYPNALVGSNGYANRNTPPEGVTLHPNLAIEFAAIWSDVLHPLNSALSWQTNVKADMMRRWCQLNSRVYLYDYDMQMLVTAITPVPGVHNLRVNMPMFKKMGLAGFIDEARNTYMEEGIQTKYLRSRMMWDPDLKVDDVLNDYYTHWYGAAAVPARAFWEHIEETLDKTPLLGHEDRVLPFAYTPELLNKLEQDLNAAEKLANDDRSKTHVRADRLILRHLQNYMAMHDAEFAGKYEDAAKQADAMLACRVELEKISPFYCITSAPYNFLISGELYWGVRDRKAHYLKLNDMLSGKTGTLIAMAPRQVKLALDPADLGRFERWHDPNYNRASWQNIDSCKPFYLQVPGTLGAHGEPYMGAMWYVFDLKVPESYRGKTVKLYTSIVVDDAWTWVNGNFAGHRGHSDPYLRPAPIDLDVTKLVEPGKTNTIAVRVHTGLSASAVADGFMGRLFLYSPK